MSMEKTGSTNDLLPAPDPTDPVTPGTPRPRLRHAVTAGASRVRRAGGSVRQKPAPAAGVLALAGGVIAVLIVRRRAAQARAAQARRRWVPARFRG